jgi:hypothetical protein
VLGESGGRPVIWAAGGDMRDLNAFLHDQTDAELGSFVIDTAFVADDGLTIGGIGHFTEAEGGYLADVGTPYVLVLDAAPLPIQPAIPTGGLLLRTVLPALLAALGVRPLASRQR